MSHRLEQEHAEIAEQHGASASSAISCSQTAVLHAALHPVTGPWSVMRDLALAQAASGRFAGVGLGVITDPGWPDDYRQEARRSGLAFYESTMPAMFGTAAFCYQRLRPPPWSAWLRDFAARSRAARVVVHLHNAWMSGVFLPLPAVPGIEVVVVATFHGVNEHFQGKPVRRALHRWMAQRLVKHGARLTSVDGPNTAVAERVFGIPASSFTVIPNGMPPPADEPVRPTRAPDAPLVLGHVGSMIPQKGWQILAEAAERLNRDRVQVRVVLAGRGPDEAAAAAWAQRHAAWAEFRGFVANPRMRVMPDLDVLCLMSQWEGLPMSIVEAMSVGLPVVATDVGGVSEAVRPGETGLLVARDAGALVAAVEGLLRDRSQLVAMGARARGRFANCFQLDRVAAHYADVYAGARS